MSKKEVKIRKALAELEVAKKAFQKEIAKFRKVYDCDTVGLDYWADGLDDTMFEIEEEISAKFEEA
jgi:hypothetical protein